jgi:5'-nucleotidase / UDP-sugar diphosphatase
MKHIKTIWLFAAWVFFFSCAENQNTGRTDLTVAILHTNDVHGKITNYPKLAAYKQELQKQYDHVLLVSAGDMFSGNPYVDFHNEKGYPMIDLMNQVGYSVSVVGNHEFDYGQQVLAQRVAQANFPLIAANIETIADGLTVFQPYHTIQLDGIELLFIGFLQLGYAGIPSTHPDKVEGFKFTNALDMYTKFLHLKDSANAFIALSHLGYETDRKLAEKTHAFDVIIGGHTHTTIKKPEYVNKTLIAQAGDDLEYVGQVELTFEQGRLTQRNYKLVNLDSLETEDKEIKAAVEGYYQNSTLNKTIGRAETEIIGKHELGCLFTDAQVATQNLDFCFQNGGGIRMDHIEQGDITPAMVFELDPFGNELVLINMTGSEVEAFLIGSFNVSKRIDLYPGGCLYTLHLNASKEADDVTIEPFSGKNFHADSTYKVGLNSYIVSSYTFDHADPGRSLNVTTAENIIEFIQKEGEVNYDGCIRVFAE